MIELQERPMRVLIVTAGSRGDVAPYTGLGQGLQHAGHHVAITFTDLPVVSANTAAIIDDLPAGLVQVTIWLAPVR